MPDVRISLSVARWIVELGRRLVQEAYARPWDPRHPEIRWEVPPELGPNHGFLERLEVEDPRVEEWLHQVIQFIRTMAAIVAHGIDEDEENISPLSSLLGFPGDSEEEI